MSSPGSSHLPSTQLLYPLSSTPRQPAIEKIRQAVILIIVVRIAVVCLVPISCDLAVLRGVRFGGLVTIHGCSVRRRSVARFFTPPSWVDVAVPAWLARSRGPSGHAR